MRGKSPNCAMKVLVIGAGIGGLATAIALKRKGINVEVYEAAPAIKEAGSGIWMATNALNVLERLGIAQEIKAAGRDLGWIVARDTHDRILLSMNLDRVKKKFGHGTTAIHRGKLQEILYRYAGVETILTGKRLRSCSQTAEGVEAQFEDGTSAHGDVLIGADGIKSVVRQELLGDIPLRYSGQTCWRGIVDFRLPAPFSEACTEIWGEDRGLRFAFSQINDQQVYFYSSYHTPAGGKDDRPLKPKLRTIYKDFQSTAAELIEAVAEDHIMRSDLFDFAPVKTWTRGRIALLGDAAHATTPNLGQGACQAVEDAYVIADCLAGTTSIERALQEYEARRIKKATMVVNRSFLLSELTNLKGRFARQMRNAAMRWTPSFVSHRLFDKLYALDF